MLRSLIVAGALVLTACQSSAPPDPDGPQMPESCVAPALQGFIGQPLSVLKDQTLPQPNRIIGPDTAVTMDYNPERLNVEHDAQDIITRIHCG